MCSETSKFKNCVLLDYYATSSGNILPTFRDNLSIPSSRVFFLILEPRGWDRMFSRKVGKKLPLHVA
jgi:hypothetical protein